MTTGITARPAAAPVDVPVDDGDGPGRTKQAFRFELDPTLDQTIRLSQHAGYRRFVFNTMLAHVKACLDARKLDPRVDVPWKSAALEAVWTSIRDDVAPWAAEEGLSSRVPKQACRDLAQALDNWSKSRKG